MPRTIKDMPDTFAPARSSPRGAASLTNEELVAAILGMRPADIDVRTMARRVVGLIQERRSRSIIWVVSTEDGPLRKRAFPTSRPDAFTTT